MALGSGIFDSKKPALPHLVRGAGGIAGEINDLRQDIVSEFDPLAAIVVEEFTNLAAAGAALISIAAASQVAAGRSATLLALAANISPPRNITVTTAGGTPADAPATATVTGTDINGDPLTEDLTIPQTATIAAGTKTFATVTSIVETAGQGTAATMSYGIGVVVGLGKKVVLRAGLPAVVKEIAAGSLAPTPGTFTAPTVAVPNGGYAPNTAANGTNDYALYYEQDLSTNLDA
jgi:hypothetical protein